MRVLFLFLCISYAAKACQDIWDFDINFAPVGTDETNTGYAKPCCTDYVCNSAIPTGAENFCVGQTYTCSCTIRTAECALNYTSILRGALWRNTSSWETPGIVLGASEGWKWILPFIGQNDTVSGWKIVETAKRQKDMGNEFYPDRYTAEYVFSDETLTAGSIFTMEVTINSALHSSPFIAVILMLMAWLL